MPDVPVLPEPERDEEFADKLVALRNRLDDRAHLALTGQPRGTARSNIRRPLLFVTAMIGVGFAPAFGTVPAVVALVAILILAMTDQVVEL